MTVPSTGSAVSSDPMPEFTPLAPRRGWARRRTAYEIIEHLMTQIYTGELRPGDRVDVESVATALGVSRSPVREAVLELQRDGFVINPYHRSATVAPFDASVIQDTFDLYGLLWSRASAAVARKAARTPEIQELAHLIAKMQTLTAPSEIDVATFQYRRRISHLGGTQRLRALLRSFHTFVPAGYRRAVPELISSQREGITSEYAATAAGDARRAGSQTRDLYRRQASIVIADLRRKGVIG